ncbi:ABC transporter permease [Gryllotalpicola ginsengisoli]|uniref:ABC transporter permease n=1 Tax=Gryllotalpicola ginsengisoli TaxID=444608 RepID=UPI0003B535F0|nr:ABC transporter permease [Gryllotalpicola ginsengisoli]
MFLTYLRRELTNRKKQTVIIGIGMALAIALVVIVSSVSSGVKAAQATALQSVYGVGTDITVTKTASAASGGSKPSFNFGSGSGSTPGSSSGQTKLNQSRLSLAMGSQTLPASDVTEVEKTAGVSKATGVLQLQDTDFSGSISQSQSSGSSGSGSSGSGGSSQGAPEGQSGSSSSSGSSGGFGGGNFSFDQTSVEGIPVSGDIVGPLTSTTTTSGRAFTASDSGKDVAILDQSYAKTNSKSVGDTIKLGSATFKIVGIVSSTSSSSSTASDVYIPLDTAQKLSGETGKVTAIYVSATSSSDVDTIKSALEKKMSGTTVSTEADLASSISGSLSTASTLISNLGKWLSIAVLAAAFLIAILFTISGVTRRTREFGTLKAIGWSNGRITRQVAGESVVQGIIGGIVGAAAGLAGILVVNIVSPTISGSTTGTGTQARSTAVSSGAPGGGGAPGFGGGGSTTSTADVVLHAPVTVDIILLAIGLSIAGGLIAGALGGWRASRLRPAEALRSVA